MGDHDRIGGRFADNAIVDPRLAGREGARTVKYKALSGDDWSQLAYQNRVERTRDYVEKKSGGKVGYLHIASMGAQNQMQFEREAYEFVVGREAMIIDVRFKEDECCYPMVAPGAALDEMIGGD